MAPFAGPSVVLLVGCGRFRVGGCGSCELDSGREHLYGIAWFPVRGLFPVWGCGGVVNFSAIISVETPVADPCLLGWVVGLGVVVVCSL